MVRTIRNEAIQTTGALGSKASYRSQPVITGLDLLGILYFGLGIHGLKTSPVHHFELVKSRYVKAEIQDHKRTNLN